MHIKPSHRGVASGSGGAYPYQAEPAREREIERGLGRECQPLPSHQPEPALDRELEVGLASHPGEPSRGRERECERLPWHQAKPARVTSGKREWRAFASYQPEPTRYRDPNAGRLPHIKPSQPSSRARATALTPHSRFRVGSARCWRSACRSRSRYRARSARCEASGPISQSAVASLTVAGVRFVRAPHHVVIDGRRSSRSVPGAGAATDATARRLADRTSADILEPLMRSGCAKRAPLALNISPSGVRRPKLAALTSRIVRSPRSAVKRHAVRCRSRPPMTLRPAVSPPAGSVSGAWGRAPSPSDGLRV